MPQAEVENPAKQSNTVMAHYMKLLILLPALLLIVQAQGTNLFASVSAVSEEMQSEVD